MKKITYLFLLVINVVLLSCSNNNEPQIPWNETGYRLDSVISFGDEKPVGKTVHYYSTSSKYCDSIYEYLWSDNKWDFSKRVTYKYDDKWNKIEDTYSTYDTDKWILKQTDLYTWTQEDNCLRETLTIILHNYSGSEIQRSEVQYEYDSLGNIVFESSESNSPFYQYTAAKYFNYYTGNRLDSVYTYKKGNTNSTFECTGKTLYLQFDERSNCTESINYNCKNDNFSYYSKYTYQYDSHSNAIMSSYYKWENDDWSCCWIANRTYQYIPGTDLVKEETWVNTSYELLEEYIVSKKYISYYTKL